MGVLRITEDRPTNVLRTMAQLALVNVLCCYQHPVSALRELQNVLGRKCIIMR